MKRNSSTTVAGNPLQYKSKRSIMHKYLQVLVVVGVSLLLVGSDLYARGGGRGGGGGGGGARAGGGGGGAPRAAAPSRSPSVSRPSGPSNMGASAASRPNASPAKPAARPSTGQAASRPSAPSSGARPATGGSATRPATGAAGSRPGAGTGAKPATGAVGAGNAGARPSSGQLSSFLDAKPSAGTGKAAALGAAAGGVAGGMAGGAAADFLKDSGARANTATARTGAVVAGAAARPGEAARAATGAAATQRASVSPERVANREQMQSNRTERHDQIQKELNDTPIRDFWQDNPGWAAFRMTAPYRHATWGAVSGWVGYGATESYPYSYGENVYYQDGSVYYDDQPVATAEEYATQAQDIVESAPEVPPEQAEWMPLGVFALTQDGEASGPKPTLYVQLAISKQGVIGGTLRNDTADTTQELEGMADKDSQRVAWTVVGQSRPIMETGIANLTEETTPVLVHFAEGETQQWLMVHLKDPQSQETK